MIVRRRRTDRGRPDRTPCSAACVPRARRRRRSRQTAAPAPTGSDRAAPGPWRRRPACRTRPTSPAPRTRACWRAAGRESRRARAATGCARRAPVRASMIDLIAPSPRPLIAVSPNRTPRPGSTEKCSWLSLMSGGSTGIAAIAALGQVHRELVGVLRLDRQQRRGEVPRVVRLEIRGLIGQERVGRRMRLVEAVPGEVLHQVEDLRGLLFIDALGAARPP